MTVREYVAMLEKDEYRTPDHKNLDDLEKKYWENIVTESPPLYGADVPGSLTDKDVEVCDEYIKMSESVISFMKIYVFLHSGLEYKQVGYDIRSCKFRLWYDN